MMKLTKKHEQFIEEYLIDLNATQAYIRAGYSPNGAAQSADRLMDKPEIKDAIDVAIAERSKRTGVTQDRVIMELARIAFLNPANVMNMNDATVVDGASEDDTAAIQCVKVRMIPMRNGETSIEREIKVADKIRALELLGKHLGMFEDKIDLSGDLDLNISIDYGADDNTPARKNQYKDVERWLNE